MRSTPRKTHRWLAFTLAAALVGVGGAASAWRRRPPQNPFRVLQRQVHALQRELAQTRTQVVDLDVELQATKLEVDDLERSLDLAETEIVDVEQELAEARTTIGQLETTLADAAPAIDLADRLADCMQIQAGLLNGLPGLHVLFEGCNVHIRNGLAATATTNGRGNLIIGYNEVRQVQGPEEALPREEASHNLIIGPFHEYTSYGGLVAGSFNSLQAEHASVLGGAGNRAIGDRSAVVGGSDNRASGGSSVVVGGFENVAFGGQSAILGGVENQTGGEDVLEGVWATVSGGQWNEATGSASSVSGGRSNTAGGDLATIGGGHSRIAPGEYDWTAGVFFSDD
jgi:hypothetical protein